MAQSLDIGHRAYVARIVQKIVDPAQAILSYQELVIEEVREAGPADALPDLERVLLRGPRFECIDQAVPRSRKCLAPTALQAMPCCGMTCEPQ